MPFCPTGVMYNSAMRFTCNSRYNIAYIRFQEKDPETEAIHVSDLWN
jgi:hypothetical protein